MTRIYRMTAPSFGADQVAAIARHLGLDGEVSEHGGSTVARTDDRVLAASGPCSRQPGVVMYVDSLHSLGEVHERPLPAEAASEHAMRLLSELDLLPADQEREGVRLSYEPSATVAEAVVFDGRKRDRVAARTDFRLRLALDGVPVNGPRTRVRLAYGNDETPILFYRALWGRLDVHDEVELIPEKDVLAALDTSIRSRRGRESALVVHSTTLAYMGDDYRGEPDLLAPNYLVEIDAGRPGKGDVPRQLLRIPAWRTPAAR